MRRNGTEDDGTATVDEPELTAGTARLPIVAGVAVAAFFYQSMMGYMLPLYFEALAFPKNAWAGVVFWRVVPWVFGPIAAGVASQRFGERRVWGAAMAILALVPFAFLVWPIPESMATIALVQGTAEALMWIGGASLVQMVTPRKKGLANGLLLMSLGVGSVLGPLVGRAALWHEFVTGMIRKGDWGTAGRFLISLVKPPGSPALLNFQIILGGLAALSMLAAAFMWYWGQRPGRFVADAPAKGLRETLSDMRRLAADARFWALVVSLCFLGGIVFQATNQYLRYRAEDAGLIDGAKDNGWILLCLLQTAIWIPGGLAVSFLAGRRASGLAGVVMLGSFSLAAGLIGWSSGAVALFVALGIFESARQFMRWSHAGYLSEHMPPDLRATAIGCSISIAGLSSAIWGYAALKVFSADAPDFDSTDPFWSAAVCGLIGAVGLFVFDRYIPIRRPECGTPSSVPAQAQADARES